MNNLFLLKLFSGLLCLLILLFAGMKWLRHVRKKRAAELVSRAESDAEQAPTPEPRRKKSKIRIEENPTAPILPDLPAISKIRIKNLHFKTVRNKGISQEAFEKSLTEQPFVSFSMGDIWPETVVDKVYLGRKCFTELNQMLTVGNLERAEHEMQGAIPEIGGFLLGKYSFYTGIQKYQISLEEFVPIKPEKNDVFQIEFSTESLVLELGDAQDQFPDMSVIGWFHTHPGHGLFLSKPDLAIHNGFFNELFQLAMEIDSLSEGLDTGFFTRAANGQVNNSVYQKPVWFSWKDIETAITSE